MNYPIPEQDFSPVHGLIIRGVTSQAIIEAVKFKLFDALEMKPATAKELAEYFEFDELKLRAMLDLLQACDLVQSADGLFSNTHLSTEYLVSSSPLYQGLAMGLTMDFCAAVNRDMGDLLKGKANKRDESDSNWGAAEAMEGTAQESLSSGLHETIYAISNLPGFEDFRLMGDLGGNHGNYTMSLLARNPKMDGMILDLPHVVPLAEERCREKGYGGRISAVGLDMREDELPQKDFDLIFASHVLYACQGNMKPLLEKIARSIRSGGWFCANHYAKTGSPMSTQTIASLEVITTFAGYFSHFIEPDVLESELRDCGFGNFRRTWSDSSKGIMLVSAQKL
ncbi:methyltransferase [Desulfovibrio sp. JC010]|uniref:methyltransferase n=1 Tax=Desulfovibrio sp. JC010 TaxID=2593641 RepID=UPI0013D75AF0|nr:methyltransferase [Desulfovibrio sp. JC010]NDV25187.1 methyltransferase domain-containing protein [Desulfovibrio sp. JC010]